jgi:hypothetical protein
MRVRWRKYGDPHVVNQPAPMRGDNHPMWAGDEVTYGGQHIRVRLFRGRASVHLCVDCSQQAYDWSYDNTGVSERIADSGSSIGQRYSTDVTQYSPRCRSCHRAFDNRIGTVRKSRTKRPACSRGHLWTEENTRWELRKGKYLIRACRTCHLENQRAYLERRAERSSF